MNVLGLSCSPRGGGNTDLLLDELLRGAAEQGSTIEKIKVARLHIKPCSQCDDCRRTGACSIRDDMQPLYGKLAEADWLILGAPIYFMAHCAQAKLLIDRCQMFWAKQHVLQMPLSETARGSRRGVFISVGATHGAKVFAGAKITMRWFFEALAMEYWGNLLFEGLDAGGAVREHPSALQQAYEMGEQIGRF